MKTISGNSHRLLFVLFIGILLISPSASGIEGPPPWNDAYAGWICVDEAIGNYCKEWERTFDGWECKSRGVFTNYCKIWEVSGNTWKCTNVEMHGVCERWEETSNGWKCTEEKTMPCEIWVRAPNGWKCTNSMMSKNCGLWTRTDDGWMCESTDFVGYCNKWVGIESGWSEVETVSTSCGCYGEILSSSGSSTENAQYQCGSICGGLTPCGKGGEDCGTCCVSYCNNAGLNAIDVKGCLNQCESVCGNNRLVYELSSLFTIVILVLSVVILAFCGIKLLTAESPDERKKAKLCWLIVLVVLVIVALAGPLVNIFYGSSGGVSPGETCVEEPLCDYVCSSTGCYNGSRCFSDPSCSINSICIPEGTENCWLESTCDMFCGGQYTGYYDGVNCYSNSICTTRCCALFPGCDSECGGAGYSDGTTCYSDSSCNTACTTPSCDSRGGTCMPQPCANYGTCMNLAAACDSGYCCAGTCSGSPTQRITAINTELGAEFCTMA